MEKMTKKEKFKKFLKDHDETIAKAIACTTILVAGIAIIIRETSKEEDAVSDDVSEYNDWVDQENAWLDEKTAEGHQVYLLHDWTYLFVPEGTETEWVNDREPNPRKPKFI